VATKGCSFVRDVVSDVVVAWCSVELARGLPTGHGGSAETVLDSGPT
jgi:hypothetical protein